MRVVRRGDGAVADAAFDAFMAPAAARGEHEGVMLLCGGCAAACGHCQCVLPAAAAVADGLCARCTEARRLLRFRAATLGEGVLRVQALADVGATARDVAVVERGAAIRRAAEADREAARGALCLQREVIQRRIQRENRANGECLCDRRCAYPIEGTTCRRFRAGTRLLMRLQARGKPHAKICAMLSDQTGETVGRNGTNST